MMPKPLVAMVLGLVMAATLIVIVVGAGYFVIYEPVISLF
jgi:hypothetical protein